MKKKPQTPAEIETLTQTLLSSIPQLSEEKNNNFAKRVRTPIPRSKFEDGADEPDLDELIGWLRKAAESDDEALPDDHMLRKGPDLGRF